MWPWPLTQGGVIRPESDGGVATIGPKTFVPLGNIHNLFNVTIVTTRQCGVQWVPSKQSVVKQGIHHFNGNFYLLAVAFDTDSLVLRYSPGNSPNERTLPSRSSSMSDSGVTLKCYSNITFNLTPLWSHP